MDHLNPDSLNFLFVQVMRMHQYRTQMLLSELGVHQGQPRILFMLWRKDGRSQKEIAEKMRVKPATITVMLNRMAKAGFLERRPDPEDMRVSRVYLTQNGRDIRKPVEAALKQVEADCYEGFTSEEKILLRRFLLHMRENLSKTYGE